MKKAIFLDRDGTINKDSKDYIKSLSEFHIFPFIIESLKNFTNLGFELIIITNQSGIGRGFFSENKLKIIHTFLLNELNRQNINLLDIYYCPHLPTENCDCRKPKIKNITKASEKYNIDLKKSWFIGDSEKDIVAGKNAKCKTGLVLTGIRDITREIVETWEIKPDFIAENLLEATKIITNLEKLNK